MISSVDVVLFGGSFNPPGKHHYDLLRRCQQFARSQMGHLCLVPCGQRKDKPTNGEVAPEHREAMIMRSIGTLVDQVDLTDLRNGVFTPTIDLDRRYQDLFANGRIWHVVGSDLIAGGADESSEIQRSWKDGEDVFEQLNFLVIARVGYPLHERDLPPNANVLEWNPITEGSSTQIRETIHDGRPFGDLVPASVHRYIADHGLYT